MVTDTAWSPSPSGGWHRLVHEALWMLDMSVRNGVAFYTLHGPHPAPDWTMSGREVMNTGTVFERANERIHNHYAA